MCAYYYQRRSGCGCWLLLFVVLLALPVTYVGSIGPVLYLQERGFISKPYPPAMKKFYAPVEWLYSHDSMKEPIDAYLQWWSMFDPEKIKINKSSNGGSENSAEPSQKKQE